MAAGIVLVATTPASGLVNVNAQWIGIEILLAVGYPNEVSIWPRVTTNVTKRCNSVFSFEIVAPVSVPGSTNNCIKLCFRDEIKRDEVR